jgi:hypothetical protein
MNSFMIKKLVQKDWFLSRYPVYMCLVLGYGGLISFLLGGFYGAYLGAVALDIAAVMLMFILPLGIVTMERKEQTLVFLMSLPISNLEYTVAKTLSCLGVYILTWSLLYIGAIAMLMIRIDIGNTIIPYFTFLFVGVLMFYALCFAIAMVTESEAITSTALAVSNVTIQVSIGLGMTFAGIRESLSSPTILWNTPIVTGLIIEVTVAVLSLAAMFYFQLRKKDFL